jgi:hypothetical protein
VVVVNDIPLELSDFEIDFQSDEWIKEEGYNNN